MIVPLDLDTRHSKSDTSQDPEAIRRRALSRWDNEGGAVTDVQTNDQVRSHGEYPPLTNAELVHLRIRVIALENLLVSLLVDASEQQKNLARKMASYILPRDGCTQHPLTIKAAEHMTDLVDRAEKFALL
jgi:hypothetical protein